jgi:hypothetical protein
MVRSNGEIVKCDQPGFDRITGFSCQDIADLKSEIERINDRKTKSIILKFIKDKTDCE